MPPKASTRGRGGRGRGGANAARAATDAPPDAPTAQDAGDAMDVDSNQPRREEGGELTATEAAASARAPVRRLEGLTTTDPTAQTASAPVRRAPSSRAKKPEAVKPTFTGRRSKQDRDAILKEQAQREKEREREQQKEDKAQGKGAFAQKRNMRGQNENRGGYSGAISGPFSGGSAPKDRRATSRITTSGSRATHMKREDGDAGEGGSSGSSSRRFGKMNGGPRGDADDEEIISSGEDDDGDAVERMDIDTIDISSDEGTGGPSGRRAVLPIRIGRKEHQERVVGINTDASSEAAAKLLQQAEATGTEIKVDLDDTVPGKENDKAKADKIKTEPASDDENMPDAQPDTQPDAQAVGRPGATDQLEPITLTSSDEETKAETDEKKHKPRVKPKRVPVLQTDEDRAEYARFLSFTQALREELGPEEQQKEIRNFHAYLFQFPPRLPNAILSDIKVESAVQTPALTPAQKKTKAAADKLKKAPTNILPDTDGKIGKIRLYESGRSTLIWGNETFDLTAGNPADFRQEFVAVDYIQPEKRVVLTEGGEVDSNGPIKGKFVASPCFKVML